MNNKILIALAALSLASATHAMDPSKKAKTDAFASRVAVNVAQEMKATLLPELARVAPKGKGRLLPVTLALTTGLVLGGLIEQQSPGTTKAVTTQTHTLASRAFNFVGGNPWSIHEAAVSEDRAEKASSNSKTPKNPTPVPFADEELSE